MTRHRIISNEPMHIHPNLEIFYRGQQVAVPANVGIDPQMYRYHGLDRYIGDMGAAPIHTHDSTGTIHVEASKTMNFQLGDFLRIWGLNLTHHHVRVFADGILIPKYRGLELRDGQQIEMRIDDPR